MIKQTHLENYYVDETGKVYTDRYSKRYNKNSELMELKPKIHKSGYVYVFPYYAPSKRAYLRMHRLVWETFNGTVPDGLDVHHKDHNKLNNSLDNLEVVTRKQNIHYYLQYKKEQSECV